MYLFRDLVILLSLIAFGVAIGWFGKDFLQQKGILTPVTNKLEQILDPTLFPKMRELELAQFPGGKSIAVGIANEPENLNDKSKLQILSASAINIVEQIQKEDQNGSKEYRLVGVRLMGELKNIGSESIKAYTGAVTFFDKKDSLLVSKKAYPNPDSTFLPLLANETGAFDLIVRDPPKDMEKIEVRIKAAAPEQEVPWVSLKVKDKSLTSHTVGSESAKLYYYQFSGTLLNQNQETVEGPTVLVWVKNSEGKVVAMQSQKYPDDLVSASKDFPVSFLIQANSLVTNPVFEVRTFAKKYEK